ncbi:MAG: 4Fe-4S ferredoxin [Deltaproteobacteria bacterium]|nr:4Fe-4S ferredoxin [Deltaproteobacteria bacterium]
MNADPRRFFIDYQRCIGCQACAAACGECHTHRGTAMIHVEDVEPGLSPQTAPQVCMHCVDPTCASVCPADAIKVDENGVVHSSLKPRCVACSNCELACPFGVPIVKLQIAQMQKCDLCFDRTSVGLRPMCATVCPSGALLYGTEHEVERLRPESNPVGRFIFGEQVIETQVRVMLPRGQTELRVDAADFSSPAALAQQLADGAQGSGDTEARVMPEGEVFFL